MGRKIAATELEGATQLDFHLLVRASDLPGIRPAEPVVGLLVLPAVLNSLTKDAVFVPQTVAHGGKLHRGHRVEETGGQAPEPAVAKAGVGFCFKHAEPIEVLLLDGLPGDGVEQEVRHIVCQAAPDEKLHRKVIDSLGVLALIGVLGEQPALREDVPDGAGNCLEAFSRARGGQFDDVIEEQVPLVKRLIRARELHRTAPVLLD